MDQSVWSLTGTLEFYGPIKIKITEDQTEALKKRETASFVTTDLCKELRSSGIFPTRIDALITFVCEHQDQVEKVFEAAVPSSASSRYNSGLVTASSLTTMVGKFTYNIRYVVKSDIIHLTDEIKLLEI